MFPSPNFEEKYKCQATSYNEYKNLWYSPKLRTTTITCHYSNNEFGHSGVVRKVGVWILLCCINVYVNNTKPAWNRLSSGQWRIQHSVVTWAPGGPVLWVH